LDETCTIPITEIQTVNSLQIVKDENWKNN
jgi:hypothetical protein